MHPRVPLLLARGQDLWPGCAVVIIVSLAASAVAARYDAPVMLFALLLGMAMSFLGEDERLSAGIRAVASTGLKLGVALMGLRVSFDLVSGLGYGGFAVIVAGSTSTVLLGLLAGRAMGFGRTRSLIAAGAVAICGASAALALASVTRDFRGKEDHTLLVIISATALSTFAMVFYPVLLGALGFSLADEGLVLGASIHDVAQVVGAGFSVSDVTGEAATLAKMARVALLPVVILLLVPFGAGQEQGRLRLPWFVFGFVLLMALNQVLALPSELIETSRVLSTVLLVCAVAALGLNSAPRKLVRASGRTFALMSGLSLWLLVWATAGVWVLS